MDYLSEIIVVINQLHRCAAVHSATVPVTEVFKDQKVWEGKIEVFTLVNHPKAKKAYAWGYPKKSEERREITTVLEIPPVESTRLRAERRIGHYSAVSRKRIASDAN